MIINILKLIFLVIILIFVIIIYTRSKNGRQEKLWIPENPKSKNQLYNKIVVGAAVWNCEPYLVKVFENIKSIISYILHLKSSSHTMKEKMNIYGF